MKISFVGDIMLGRFIVKKYNEQPYDIVSPDLIEKIKEADLVVGNLESPITKNCEVSKDHLVFQGNPQIIKEFNWVDCLSLSNNHINDCGEQGMDDTAEVLNENAMKWNGLFKEDYEPYFFQHIGQKIAIITCADMMNHEFAEDNDWKTIRIDDPILDNVIKKYRNEGYFVILYAHVGILFTRFPNPQIREFCHNKIDLGVDMIVTVHPHVLGGMEVYKDKNIFYSLGDFVMDGSSFRRRRSGVLSCNIENNQLKSWEILCVNINNALQTTFAEVSVKNKMLKSFNHVTEKLEKHTDDYASFYSKQYKKEIIQHSLSTLFFIYKNKGLKSLFRLLFTRMEDVFGMLKRTVTNRKNMRYDSDAVNHNKKMSSDDIY
ncbi:MAG: CapA family protein [Dysgonomonas sp.]|nr:CapA family protein [Dysgonomonas sp.]